MVIQLCGVTNDEILYIDDITAVFVVLKIKTTTLLTSINVFPDESKIFKVKQFIHFRIIDFVYYLCHVKMYVFFLPILISHFWLIYEKWNLYEINIWQDRSTIFVAFQNNNLFIVKINKEFLLEYVYVFKTKIEVVYLRIVEFFIALCFRIEFVVWWTTCFYIHISIKRINWSVGKKVRQSSSILPFYSFLDGMDG